MRFSLFIHKVSRSICQDEVQSSDAYTAVLLIEFITAMTLSWWTIPMLRRISQNARKSHSVWTNPVMTSKTDNVAKSNKSFFSKNILSLTAALKLKRHPSHF